MKTGPRGGILLDLFLIVVLCAGAVALWITRDRWSRAVFARGARQPSASAVSTQRDLTRESARAQARVRAFLKRTGIPPTHLLKDFAEQKSARGHTWMEATLELGAPDPFDKAAFLKALARFAAKRDPWLMKDEDTPAAWTLEFGDRERVFQRVILRPWGNRP